MRVAFVGAGIAWILNSCVMVGDAPVSGKVHDVTVADIRAAIAADYEHAQPLRIHVTSKDQIDLYYGSRTVDIGHHVIKRINGKWQYYTEIVITN